MTQAIKETKAQRIERLKRAKNPWDCLQEIHAFARLGYDAIPPEWLCSYFRWWAVFAKRSALEGCKKLLGEIAKADSWNAEQTFGEWQAPRDGMRTSKAGGRAGSHKENNKCVPNKMSELPLMGGASLTES